MHADLSLRWAHVYFITLRLISCKLPPEDLHEMSAYFPGKLRKLSSIRRLLNTRRPRGYFSTQLSMKSVLLINLKLLTIAKSFLLT